MPPNFVQERVADCSHSSQSLHQEQQPGAKSFPY